MKEVPSVLQLCSDGIFHIDSIQESSKTPCHGPKQGVQTEFTWMLKLSYKALNTLKCQRTVSLKYAPKRAYTENRDVLCLSTGLI